MITADRNILAQQRLAGREVALVVMSTNHWDTIKVNAASVISACDSAGQGAYIVVQLPHPLLRRRHPAGCDS